MTINIERQLITHAGVFHGDDVMATAILKLYFKDEKVKVLRVKTVTEEMKNDAYSVIYDIGGGKFDHHQSGGNGFHKDGTPYASCGLIWKEYGKRLCKELVSGLNIISADDLVWETINNELVIGVDAHDNGIWEGKECTISSAIKAFNPTWDEETSEASVNEAFNEAVEFATVLLNKLFKRAISKAKAIKEVRSAELHSANGIMVLNRFVPWADALDSQTNVHFVIYPSLRGGYNIQNVPGKAKFPKEWWGYSSEGLQNRCGVKDAMFCHKDGFLATVATLPGAIKLAQRAMNYRYVIGLYNGQDVTDYYIKAESYEEAEEIGKVMAKAFGCKFDGVLSR